MAASRPRGLSLRFEGGADSRPRLYRPGGAPQRLSAWTNPDLPAGLPVEDADQAEAAVEVPVRRRVPEAGPCPAAGAVVVPGAAPEHPVRAVLVGAPLVD